MELEGKSVTHDIMYMYTSVVASRITFPAEVELTMCGSMAGGPSVRRRPGQDWRERGGIACSAPW
jgi:hypothetical protein